MKLLTAAFVTIAFVAGSQHVGGAPIVSIGSVPQYLDYNPLSGELFLVVETTEKFGDARAFNLIELRSASSLFNSDQLIVPVGTLVTRRNELLGFVNFGGIFIEPGETYNLGAILPAGLGLDDLAEDITGQAGTLGQPNRELGFGVIPEPATGFLAALAIAGGVAGRRRRHGLFPC